MKVMKKAEDAKNSSAPFHNFPHFEASEKGDRKDSCHTKTF